MADNTTFMEIPPDVDDPLVLRRFLTQLLVNLDKAFGNRGNQGFVDASGALGISSAVADQAFSGQTFSNVKRYGQEFDLDNDRDLIDLGFLEENSTNNLKQATIADAAYTKANPGGVYSQSEAITVDDGVDSNATKINEILVALKAANIIEV